MRTLFSAGFLVAGTVGWLKGACAAVCVEWWVCRVWVLTSQRRVGGDAAQTFGDGCRGSQTDQLR